MVWPNLLLISSGSDDVSEKGPWCYWWWSFNNVVDYVDDNVNDEADGHNNDHKHHYSSWSDEVKSG